MPIIELKLENYGDTLRKEKNLSLPNYKYPYFVMLCAKLQSIAKALLSLYSGEVSIYALDY